MSVDSGEQIYSDSSDEAIKRRDFASQEGKELHQRDSEVDRSVGVDGTESQEIFKLIQRTAAFPKRKAATLLSFMETGRLTPTRDFSGGEPRGYSPEKSWGIPSPAYARTCYSSLRLSDLVGYLNTTYRAPVRTAGAVQFDYVFTEFEAAGIRIRARHRRPIVAPSASRAYIAVAAVAIACSREEHLRGGFGI